MLLDVDGCLPQSILQMVKRNVPKVTLLLKDTHKDMGLIILKLSVQLLNQLPFAWLLILQ